MKLTLIVVFFFMFNLVLNDAFAYVANYRIHEVWSIVESTEEYIPYSYTKNDCQARSLIISMKLATYRIPTLTIIMKCKGNKKCLYNGVDRWVYHVAPMVVFSDDTPKNYRKWGASYTRLSLEKGESSHYASTNRSSFISIESRLGLAIFDPSLAGSARDIKSWIYFTRAWDNFPAVTLDIYPGSVSLIKSTPRYSKKKPLVLFFDEMPNFKASDLSMACAILTNNIYKENHLSNYEKSIKSNNLKLEIKRGIARLKELKKLDQDINSNQFCFRPLGI